MDLIAKIGWLFAIALILGAGYGIAKTESFNNRTDALAALDGSIILTPGDCKVLQVTETINSGEGSGNIIAQIEMGFYKPNWDRRLDSVVVSSTNQATIESETIKPCEDLWASIQAEPQFQTVDTVIVEYHEGELAGILNRAYNVITKQWQNITAQAEP